MNYHTDIQRIELIQEYEAGYYEISGVIVEIYQLKEFKSLAGTLSYSETAFRLNVSTSALSRHIQNLEGELGESLFDRSSRPLSLTQFGHVFLPHAIRIIQEYDDGMEAIRRFREHRELSLTMGVTYSIAEYSTSFYIKDFQHEHPNCSLRLVTGSLSDIERGFREGLFNVYTAIRSDKIAGLNFIKIGENSIRAAVCPASPLADRDVIRLTDLGEYDLYIPPEGNTYYDQINQVYRDANMSPSIVYTGRFSDCVDLIRDNKKAVALFPFMTGRNEQVEGLVFLDTYPKLNNEYGIGYRKDLSPAEKLVVNHLKKFEL